MGDGAALLADIAEQNAVPQNAQIGVVDAGKGVKALGPGLFGSISTEKSNK